MCEYIITLLQCEGNPFLVILVLKLFFLLITFLHDQSLDTDQILFLIKSNKLKEARLKIKLSYYTRIFTIYIYNLAIQLEMNR